MPGERRTVTIADAPVITIEELDEGLNETVCVVCNPPRPLSLCPHSPAERAARMMGVEALSAASAAGPFFDRLVAWWRRWRRDPPGR